MPPRRTSFCAWPVRGPPLHLCAYLCPSVCLTVRLSRYTVNARQPARRLQHRARQVPPLQSACVRRYVYHHCFWDCGLVSNHRQKVVLSIPWDMVVSLPSRASWPTRYFVATSPPLRRSKFADSGTSAIAASPFSPVMIPPRVQRLTEEIMFVSGP